MPIFRQSFNFLSSIWLTIPLLAITTLLVATATFLEGSSGSHRLAEGWIYHHPLFYFVLSLYFINILFSTFTRWPFKRRHIPFLLTHLGLLMMILGVAMKGFFGLQGVMRIHEGEGSHIILLEDQKGLFGNTGFARYSFRITPGMAFKEGELSFFPLGISPHGKRTWNGWMKDGWLDIQGLPKIPFTAWDGSGPPSLVETPFGELSALETNQTPSDLQKWKGSKPWLMALKDEEEKITLAYLQTDGSLEQKTFDPHAPGEIVVFDGGRGGYGLEFGPFSTTLEQFIEIKEPPEKLEDARPILQLKVKKGDETELLSLLFEPGGTGLSTPVFDTLLKFQPVVVKIPNHLYLHQAKTIYRPGTTTPEAYEAKVLIDGSPFTLKMNQVFESEQGYRFYLSKIIGDPGEVKEVHLAVNYDPAKYFLTYPGGGLVVLGALLLLFRKKSP